MEKDPEKHDWESSALQCFIIIINLVIDGLALILLAKLGYF